MYVKIDNRIDKRAIIIGLSIVFSIMMARVCNHIATYYTPLPFREIFGLNILFVYILPLIIIFLCFRNTNPVTSLIVTFVSFGIIFTIVDGIWLMLYDISIMDTIFNPLSTVPKLMVGLGFGTIAYGVSVFKSRKIISAVAIIAGVLFVCITIPDLPLIFYGIIFNDSNMIQYLKNR